MLFGSLSGDKRFGIGEMKQVATERYVPGFVWILDQAMAVTCGGYTMTSPGVRRSRYFRMVTGEKQNRHRGWRRKRCAGRDLAKRVRMLSIDLNQSLANCCFHQISNG